MFKFNCQELLDVQLSGVTPQLLQLYEDLDTELNNCNAIQVLLDGLSGNTFNYVIPSNGQFLCLTNIGVAAAQTIVEATASTQIWQDYLDSGDPSVLPNNLAFLLGLQQAGDGTEVIYFELCEDGELLIQETMSWIQLSGQLETCQNNVNTIQNTIESILAAEADNCLYVIDAFEDLSVEMAIEVQDPISTSIVTTAYSEEIYNAGAGNLFSYLTSNIQNPLYINGYNGVTCTNDTCDELAKILTQQLITEGVNDEILTGDTYFSQYTQLLELIGDNSFETNWLTYTNTISDPAIISGITGQEINISIRVVDACVDFSILVDRIVLNKVCERVINEDIFVNSNPAFDITKVCDNKKSWVSSDIEDDRQFLLPLRETEYSTNNSRLVINTKEVDLNMSISNGIETDVWCYVNDNPCILEPCTPEYNTIITTGSSCSSTPNLTGATNWTGGTTPFVGLINSGVDPNFSGEILRLNWAANGTAGYPASAFTTTQYGDCAFIHRINIQATAVSPTRFNGAWIVGNYDGTVDWFYNRSWSGNTEVITRYSDTISGETGCNIVMSGISEYNTLQGTDFTNVYWDSATSACTFVQPPNILTGTTIVNGCCCGQTPLSGTNITGGTVALPPLLEITPCDRVVGGEGPAGGIVYWVNPEDACEGYEVMPFDQSTSTSWMNLPTTYIGGTSTDFGTGAVNTAAMVANVPPAAAAALCDALSYGGFNDWFLPSIDDLVVIAANTSALSALTNGQAYWSSSEGPVTNPDNAWGLVGTTTPELTKKDFTRNVRAVRYFNTNQCNAIYSALTASTIVNGIQEEYTDCSWIYKFDLNSDADTFDGYWLAGMPDNTLGVFQHITVSGGTGTTIDYSEITSKYCCEAYNDVVQDYAWETAKGDYYTQFRWDDTCEQCKVVKCTDPHCVDIDEMLTTEVTGVTTIKEFNNIVTSELINVRCRKITNRYPLLRALYERYMNSTEYCGTLSAQFDYETMSNFTDLVGNYWVDLIEQVMPSTAIWEASQIYGNTIYDQQKFQYKGYTTFPCTVSDNQLVSGLEIRATSNVDVDIRTLSSDGLCVSFEQCSDVHFVTGDCGSEFLGMVLDPNNPNIGGNPTIIGN